MDPKIEKYEKFQKASHNLLRIRNFLALYGVGVYFWIDYLWGLLIEHLKSVDEKLDNWFLRLFVDQPLKIYPIVNALDILAMMIFIVCMSYIVYWIHADISLKLAYGKKVKSFKHQILIAIVFNSVIYAVLRLSTDAYRSYG